MHRRRRHCSELGQEAAALLLLLSRHPTHQEDRYRCILDGYYAAVVSKGPRLKEKVMNITIASKLMELYAACPKCGCEVIGNGKGLLECDTAAGFFKRSCGCGWHVEVMEGITEGSQRDR